MASLSDLSAAQVIILATHLSAENNLQALQQLQRHHAATLRPTLVLRILLTFLPESIEPQLYTPFLLPLSSGSSPSDVDVAVDTTFIKDLSPSLANKKVRKLRLLPLIYTPSSLSTAPTLSPEDAESDPLTAFLVSRAYRIDAETGLLPLVLQSVEPFVDHSEYLRTWLIASVLPLLRLNYEFYPDSATVWSIEAFEQLDVNEGVKALLSRERNEEKKSIGRDLRGLVGPWVYGNIRSKRRKVSEDPATEAQEQKESLRASPKWSDINDWLVETSYTDFKLAIQAVEEWKGPRDVDLGDYEDAADWEAMSEDVDPETQEYAQAALRCILSTQDDSRDAIDGSYRILCRVADMSESIDRPPALPDESHNLPDLQKVPGPGQFEFEHMIPSNALILALYALTASCRVLRDLEHPMSCQRVAKLRSRQDRESQELELKKILDKVGRKSRSLPEWTRVLSQLSWLRSWRVGDHEESLGVFGEVDQIYLEAETLKTILKAGDYHIAVDLFCRKAVTVSLSLDKIEALVKHAALDAYDNASNGNRTRGGAKKASDIIKAFRPEFPKSKAFQQLESLLAATHSLSFYSLTLQHGVPFQPVSIRVHQDPIALIGKVLDQNPRGYTKLDDLLSIGRNLVEGLEVSSVDNPTESRSVSASHEAFLNAERRITSLAISAALNENDFGTAYSYITTRLTPNTSKRPNSGPESDEASIDDISWRAAYEAGRYRPNSSTSQTSTRQLQNLTQRLELLSLALILAPTPTPLPEILASWRRCDEEMNTLRIREAEEESAWDDSGDTKNALRNASTTVPGAFSAGDSPVLSSKSRPPGKGGYNEEAPMGLFDVARGAARALGKSAFPLRGGATNASRPARSLQQGTDAAEPRSSQESERTASGEGRVRKRDMVSNMVTGGLASGIGWVLGAQPASNPNNEGK